ncbi:ATP-grasp domain-containing protein [Bacillus sp. SS-TM]
MQRYLEGPHYVVNAMTHEGKHFITDIWRHDFFKGNGTTVIYDKIQLMPYDRKHYYEMTKYVEDIITILGIQYGPTHTEVRLTNEGPRLVEVNCRTMGLSLKEEVISDALSYSHSSFVNLTSV